MSELRILLADDDPDIRTHLAALLGAHGVRVVACVESGEEAIEAAARHVIDVALLDVDMPGTNGIAVASHLHQHHPGVTVIMLTAFRQPDSLAQALSAGASGFLTKDIPAAQLIDLIKQAHAGHTVLGPKPIDVLAKSYTERFETQQRYQEFNDRVATLPNHLKGTFNLLLDAKTNKEIAA